MKENELIEKTTEEVAKGGSIALFGKILEQLLFLPVKIILARFLGTRGLGLFSLGQNITNWLSTIAKIGLNHGAIRFVSLYKGENNEEKLKGTLFLLLIVPTIISSFFGLLLFVFPEVIAELFNKPELTGTLSFFGIALPFLTLGSIILSILGGFRRIDQKVKLELLKGFSYLMIILLMFVFSHEIFQVYLSLDGTNNSIVSYKVYGAIFALIASSIFSILLGLNFIKNNFPNLFSSLKYSTDTSRIMKFSLPMLFAVVTWTLTRQVDIIMIGYFLPSEQVGVYSIATLLSVLILFPLSSIEQIFSPVISDLYNQKKITEMKKLYKKSTRWVYAASIPIFFVLIVFSGEILGTIFGTEFLVGREVLLVLASLTFIFMLPGPVGFILQMTDNQNWVLYTNFASGILNVVLNLTFIPMWGIIGAALATGISLTLNNFFELYIVNKKLGMHPWEKDYLKLFLPISFSILAFLILNNLNFYWLFSLIIFTLIYFITLYWKGLSKEDRKFIDELRVKHLG